MSHLMTEFPGRGGNVERLDDLIFWLAEIVGEAFVFQIEGKRKAGQTIGEDTIVDITATGEITGERGGVLPHFTSAARVLVVALGERLVSCQPETLHKKQQEQPSGDALGQVEAKAAKSRETKGHLKV